MATASAFAVDPIFHTSDRCMACHNGLVDSSGKDISIGANWRGSLMAHSARDPYWQAAVRREITDHPEARQVIEDKCASCHMPMARFMLKTNGNQGNVFTHLPLASARSPMDALANDGVSCTMCHQITQEKLGTKESFTAGFVVDSQTPFGERSVFGPYDVDAGRTRVMQSSAQFVPTTSKHLQNPAFCASCHTLYTHALDSAGNEVGELPEQVPYLEWKHSAYRQSRTCQSCHMPTLAKSTPITSVLGQPREGFSQHVFRGGNFLLPKIFIRHRIELGVAALPADLAKTANETTAHLQSKSAIIMIQPSKISDDRLQAEVSVKNLAGHKLPSAYPSRRVWLNLTIRDRVGRVIFSSGKLNPDGSIEGNDNDTDSTRFEPHYTVIENPGQVQIYEAIMEDHQGKVTTGLLYGVNYGKDNRLLPVGFEKQTAPRDIAVQGKAVTDANFNDQGDSILYSLVVDKSRSPFTVEAKLYYQPIGYRWAKNLQTYDTAETQRFVRYFDGLAPESAVVLAQVQKIVE